MARVHVLAVITAKPGKRTDLLELFQANVPAVHAENGCIEYGATIDHENAGDIQSKYGEDSFVVVEKWDSLDALKAHAVAPHMNAYGAKAKDLIADRRIYVMSDA